MNRHSNKSGEKYQAGHAKQLLVAAAMLPAVSLLLYWVWNSFAVEILSQKEMQFKHALALESLLAASLAMVFALRRDRFGDHDQGK